MFQMKQNKDLSQIKMHADVKEVIHRYKLP